jgi:threonine synthase
VHNIAIDGSFDDCQDLVKAMFADHAFRDSLHLSAVNSINWARILAQVVYYVHSAALIHARTGRAPVFCVPTGNFGNVYAGYIAKSMGVPVEKFLVATNSNDILHRFFTTGRMKSEGSTFTVSPSMDIQVSSNFERLLFEVFGRQGAAVDATMRHFREKGPYHLEPSAMQELLKTFSSGRKDDAETLDIMRRIHAETGYMLDPHTAVGVGVAQDYKSKHPDSVIVSLATAHAAKFPDAARKATGITPALPAHMADLYDRAERFDVMQPDLALVQKYVRERVKV